MHTRLVILSLPLAACATVPPSELPPPPMATAEVVAAPVVPVASIAYPETRRMDLVEP